MVMHNYRPLRNHPTYATLEITLASIYQNCPTREANHDRESPGTTPPLPDPPQREPEDMTSFGHLTKNGGVHHLHQYFGNRETTIV